jgi:archaetidylinositol phosphate synthase
MVERIALALTKARIPPDLLTILGFVLAVVAGLLYAFRNDQPYLAAVLIVLSGIADVLDGAVARVTNKVSKRGSFNDSTLDRVSEIAIFAGILYGGYLGGRGYVVLLALGFSLLVSYMRAKGESLSVKVSGVGVGERAERLIVLIIFSLVNYVWIGVYIVLILAFVTFVQRYIYIYSGTPKGV